MKPLQTKLAVATALGAVLATTAFASAYPGQALASQATVDIAQARTTALRTVPGSIASEELEREAGGSGLRYTFDIKGKNGVREVGVDAKSGKVLENSADSAPARSESSEGDGD